MACDKPWLEHYDEGVPTSIDEPFIPLGMLPAHSEPTKGTGIAISFGLRIGPWAPCRQLTWNEVEGVTERLASGLQALGIRKGDRVAVLLPNCPQMVFAMFAIWRIGAISVTCNPVYVARELKHTLLDSGARVIIAMSVFADSVAAIRATTALERVVLTGIEEYLPGSLKLLVRLRRLGTRAPGARFSEDPNVMWIGDLLKHAPESHTAVDLAPGDGATLLYTSGTTGEPKGALLTHGGLVHNARASSLMFGLDPEPVVVAQLPFFHVGGIVATLLVPALSGGHMLLVSDPHDTRYVLMLIQKYAADAYCGVPTMIDAINKLPGVEQYELSSLKLAGSTGAPVSSEVRLRFSQMISCGYRTGYGLTESGGIVTIEPKSGSSAGSVGLPVPDTDVRVVDSETGSKELEAGEPGEIIVRGPQLMDCYWNRPKDTAAVLRTGPDAQSGWLHTGDIGYLDRAGFLFISDRRTDLIISGGNNVYPAEVEDVLLSHASVAEAAVVGVADEARGETVKACVVLQAGREPNCQELTKHCEKRLAAYKIPLRFEQFEALPKSAVGKILRRELRE